MSKTETLRQHAAQSNEKWLEHLATQIDALRQERIRSAEELAAQIEPLAQAMAALTDETRQTLSEIDRTSREQSKAFARHLSELVRDYKEAAAGMEKAAAKLNLASQRLEWRHYGLALLTGLASAVLVSVFWLWLAPPTVHVQNKLDLDARAVADYLRPAVIEALRHYRGR